MENKLKVMIIGCGRVSAKHLKAIKKLSDKCELKALVDVVPGAPEKLLSLSKFPAEGVSFYSDYEKAIEELKPDIVAITVPSGLHCKIAEFALNHGCHILLEKPMTMSSAESKYIYDVALKNNRKIAMGHIYRYFPLVSLLQKDISSGVFGKVTHGTIYVRWGHGDDYYNSAAWRGTWKADGGAMMNQTIHAIDLLVWLMGSTPVEAQAMLAQRLRKIEAEDLGMATLRMSDGSLASIEGTTATSEKEHSAMFSVFCENGSISLGLHKGMPKLNIRDGRGKKLNGKYIRRQLKSGGISSMLNALNPHTGIYADFIDAIENDRAPIADGISGYSSVDTLMGIYKSALLKHPVALPLEENFASENMIGFFEKSC